MSEDRIDKIQHVLFGLALTAVVVAGLVLIHGILSLPR